MLWNKTNKRHNSDQGINKTNNPPVGLQLIQTVFKVPDIEHFFEKWFCPPTGNNSLVRIKSTNNLQISDDEKDNSIKNENRYEQDPMATNAIVIGNSTKTKVIKSGHIHFCEIPTKNFNHHEIKKNNHSKFRFHDKIFLATNITNHNCYRQITRNKGNS